MARTKNAGILAYDLRVTLLYMPNEIWRLVRVPHDIRMGWPQSEWTDERRGQDFSKV